MMKKNLIHIFITTVLVALMNIVCAQLLPPSAQGSKPAPVAPPAPISIMEGVDYQALTMAQPTEAKGKIEVTEFFWYGCPHCFEFDAELHAWVKKQKNIVFKRVPVAFRPDFLPHSQLFYALEALGKEEEFTPKVFKAIHLERKQLLKEEDIFKWIESQGLDPKAFTKAYQSFSVITKAKTANNIMQSYRIEGVPTIAIHGRYITSPSIAGSRTRALETMDFLVAKARAQK